ncbi:hypothetical protein BOX15_Mlig031098g2 [Macrostomum lignano]|uniref:Uncharacterized protein n=3 Tax=Macrostomum lignano TaxID=282301 RepID=A0A267FNM3_9PLAT|nr:hypothetical protein BOX15_Mlig031098g3 [Macrostomum lignano]PAA88457.1 hypothetical protein BOX15_Mlig031098g2 [Macrostomum lignano]
MANHGKSYGLSAELDKKREEKRDSKQEEEVLDWIEAVIKQSLPRDQPYEDILADGIVLCDLMSAIKPGSIKKINRTTRMPFKLMENIGSFLEAARVYGVPSCDLFQTVDLFEKKNISQVTQCLFALGRTCQAHPDYDGPTLGPKLSEENRRQFTEEQLSAGKNVIGLQAGYNKGASQAGMSFGKARKILD